MLFTCMIDAVFARVTRFEVTERESFADGAAFGDVGAYERIRGKVYFAIDPASQQNQSIVDLRHASVNASGQVEFTSDFVMLAPANPRHACGAILYGVNNRGNVLSLKFFNDADGSNDPRTIDHAGNGFLFRKGWVFISSGWDGELLPGGNLLRIDVPVADNASSPIIGPVRYETFVNKPVDRVNINAARSLHGAYRPTARGLREATLTWRLHPEDPRVSVPRDQFRLDVQDGDTAASGSLPLIELVVPSGLEPGYIYELIYEARDPRLMGCGLASVRDLMSALKHGEGEGNPLVHDGKSIVQRVHGFGVSQSGRFLREFVHAGFNEDEDRRKVFDGLMPHVAGGGLGSFNHRFAQPTSFNTQHELHDFCSDRFPFTYGDDVDPYTEASDGILRRARRSDTQPMIMHTQSAAEYWTRAGSLPHTGAQANSDARLPENVRIYSFGGTQHGPASWPPGRGEGRQLTNPGDYRPMLRALLLALDRWAEDGTSPPASVYPRIDDGTLLSLQDAASHFPKIPGVRYPDRLHQPMCLDFGPRWNRERIIDFHPPKVQGRYKTLVPTTDQDGNDRGCLLPPEVAVPVATFTGWNLRHRNAGAENALLSLAGSYIPFPVDEAERMESGDPRASVRERYATREAYLDKLRSHCEAMVHDRYLLPEDIATVLERQSEITSNLWPTR
ncbi:MAG: alpha/beta hydrolase domain-containing protein [Pirellulaceae bacterium]